ncbi:MAG TPA: hypothetical protein DDW99_02930, partial [Ruminococcaceae bacterium]|nr:hypothetical protein [Oscillospiraceae bacterium]
MIFPGPDRRKMNAARRAGRVRALGHMRKRRPFVRRPAAFYRKRGSRPHNSYSDFWFEFFPINKKNKCFFYFFFNLYK